MIFEYERKRVNLRFAFALLVFCGGILLVGCQSGETAGPVPDFSGEAVPMLDKKPFLSKNIIPNGSFELGFDCGWSGEIRQKDWRAMHPEVFNPAHVPEIDSSTAAKGKQSVRLVVPKHGWGWVSSPTVKVESGQNYTISFYLRSDQDSTPAYIGLGGKYSRGKIMNKKVTVGKEWKRYSISGKSDSSSLYVRADAYGPCTLWVDGAQMEKGKMTEYSQEAPVEVRFQVEGASMREKKRVYDKGDEVSLSTEFIRHDPTVKKLKVDYTLMDYLGNERSLPSEKIDLNGVACIKKQFVLPCDSYGTFKLRVTFDGGTAESKGFREFIYAVIPKQKNIDFCKDSPFGCKVEESQGLSMRNADTLKRIGVKWITGVYTMLWTQVEKEKGKFTWHDFRIQGYHERGFCFLGDLHGVPGWAAGKPDAPKRACTKLFPKTFKDWNNFVAKIVARYKGKVQAWNVWNEPYGYPRHSTLTIGTEPPVPGTVGDPEYYVKMLEESYKTIKRVDPSVTVVGACVYPGYPKYLDGVLKNGALNYMDVLAIHDYTFIPPEACSGGTKARINKLRDLMVKNGGDKPIWNTEFVFGWRSNYSDRNPHPYFKTNWPGTTSSLRAASRYVRLYLTSLSVGVEKLFPFRIEKFFEYDDAPSDILSSYAAMTHIMSETPKFISRVDLADGVYCFVFQRSDGKFVAILWSVPEQLELNLALSSDATLLDIMGNKLSALKSGAKSSIKLDYAPVYLLGDWADGAAVVKDISVAGISGLKPLTISSSVLNDRNKGLVLGIKAICGVASSKKNMLHIKEHPASVDFKSRFIKINDLRRGQPKQVTVPIKSLRATAELTSLKGSLTTEEDDKYSVDIPFSLLASECASKAKVVDGDPGDWKGCEWIEIKRPEQVKVGYTKPTIDVTDSSTPILPYWHGTKDLSGKVAVAWDSKNMYFIFDVTDDKVNFDSATPLSDSVELFLDFDEYRDMNKNQYSDNTWQIVFSPGLDGALKANYRVLKPLAKDLPGVEMVSRKTTKGYVLEVAVPLKDFDGFIPRNARAIAFDVALNDKDSEKKRKTQMVWSGDKDNWVMPSHFGSLVFLKKEGETK